MELSTVNQRVNFLVTHFEKGNKSAFAEKIGVKPAVVNDLVGGRMNKPSFDTLGKVFAAYPSVNTDWLIKGVGEPFDAQIPKVYPYPPGQTNVHAVGLLSDIPIIKLRRVSFKARASFGYAQLQRFRDGDIFDTVLFRLPPGRTEEDYKDALVFDIEGDSMEPSLRDGQQVIAWPISDGRWEYLHNTICVVDYAEEVTVKAILKNDLNNTEGITLHATGGLGGSFTVERKDIHSIWEVREFYGIVPVRLIP